MFIQNLPPFSCRKGERRSGTFFVSTYAECIAEQLYCVTEQLD